MNKKQSEELANLYNTYNETIKPLIALIEARFEKFPLPIFNEIRAFNDHVAQCYRKGIGTDYIQGELNRAERHIKRIVFDCFKYLNVSLNDFVVKFEKQTKKIDLTTINNGDFFVKYKKLRASAIQAVRDAKKVESKDNQTAFEKYEEAFNIYCDLEELINSNFTNIIWARAKFNLGMIGKIILWLLAAILSGVISSIVGINYTNLLKFLGSIF